MRAAFFTLVALAAMSGCAPAAEPVHAPPAAPRAPAVVVSAPTAPLRKDLLETALATGKLGRFAAAVRAAGLEARLRGPGPLTVFAPVDAAFERLPPRERDALLGDRERLARVLSAHVVQGKLRAVDLASAPELRSIDGATLAVRGKEAPPVIGDARLLMPDIEASNGILHAVDALVADALPPILAVAAEHRRFVALLERAGMIELLAGPGPFTLLAPTDEALAALPLDALPPDKLRALAERHVLLGELAEADLRKIRSVRSMDGATLPVEGRKDLVTIGGTTLVTTDLRGSNGLVHVVSGALVPPAAAR